MSTHDTASTSETMGGQPARALRGLNKVPQVTVYFWIVKILTTGTGEAASDFLVRSLGALAVGIAAVAWLATLALQFRVRRYLPWVYWSAIVMVGIFGTMAADIPHFLGLSLWVTSAFYLAALAVIFGTWYALEGTLSFSTVNTGRREIFYWAAVLATFALGTAVGDLTAHTWHLGYLASGVMFVILILIAAGASRWPGASTVMTFWCAYVLTRPLGASFADWMSARPGRGGLGLGTGAVTLCGAAIIVGFVTYLATTHKDVQDTPATIGG